MIQERLNDAAIALHRVLGREHIRFGIFGGYAIGATGGVRESKGVDCLVSASKAQIMQLLTSRHGFQAIPSRSRQEDHVAFQWSDRPDGRDAVVVAMYFERFPGSRHALGAGACNHVAIHGRSLGPGTSSFLKPFLLFKSKLCAAATRVSLHDSVDLRLLARRHGAVIKCHAKELNLEHVGLAMKRYPDLGRLFEGLGVDVQKAMGRAQHLDPHHLPRPASGDVQRGLLG
ncbi:hypothetical protein JDV02_010385 [Purpureocillium takamizusanense]|uniref:Nucleotidyltransferase family protein n=1 Tax=Purpureocillium takamizusanense TaxID=2060973 RepID=A0A9Q8QS47_9HYPO|nr:uncharacterized protein JDV02_010385 [Purpureocillium takamizusanense]UNI24653.1 hypothetical protein JDV02_010385 [Purpureocillium takamizusanense]